MAGKIPQQFIDDLLERTDIVDVIDSRINLKKTGRNYSALCPFHNEKTPSFSVNPDKQFYYCFGCGAGGNAVSFLMEYERFDFPQAVESLAQIAGVEVPRDEQDKASSERTNNNRELYHLLEKASDYYQQQLRQHEKSSTAIEYLKARGLSGTIAKQFGIGYAPPGWSNLLDALPASAKEINLLIDGGMLINKDDGGRYDRFRDRIMFPIRDTRGRVIGFGGRVLGDEKPKYLNSPETPVFHKGKELYGLYEARKHNRQLDKILIVEGYMDVIALAQFDIHYAVATLGTATTTEHIEKIFRQCNEVVFCFDGDRAGRAAADKALDTVLPTMQDGRQARFLFLPDGEDPDTLVRKETKPGFELRLSKAETLSDYLFNSASKGLDLNSMDAQARFAKQALEKIQHLPQKGMLQQLMLKTLSERTSLPIDQLNALLQNSIEVDRAKLAERQRVRERVMQQKAQSDTNKTEKPNTPKPSGNTVEPPLSSGSFNTTPNNTAAVSNKTPTTSNHTPDPVKTWPEYDQPPPSIYDSGSAFNASEQKAQSDKAERIDLSHLGQKKVKHPPARKAITLLLNYPSLAAELNQAKLDLAMSEKEHDSDLQLLDSVLAVLAKHPDSTPYSLLGHWVGKPEQGPLVEMMTLNHTNDTNIAKIELDDILDTLITQANRRDQKDMISQLGQQKDFTLANLTPSQQVEYLKMFAHKDKK